MGSNPAGSTPLRKEEKMIFVIAFILLAFVMAPRTTWRIITKIPLFLLFVSYAIAKLVLYKFESKLSAWWVERLYLLVVYGDEVDVTPVYKSWFAHNVIAHPLMHIFKCAGKTKWSTAIHDVTLPEQEADPAT